MRVEFTPGNLSPVLRYKEEPVIRVSKLVFSLIGSDWVPRLIPANLTVKISGLDKEGLPSFTSQEFLLINITPYHKQPVFEEKRFFRVPPNLPGKNVDVWNVEITVNNLELKDGESLSLSYIDHDYIKKRVMDWAQRVRNLFHQISSWAKEFNSIEVRPSRKLPMHEGLMKDFKVSMHEMDSADVFKNGKLIFAIKPFGLWILGANGRVDILSAKGNYILVDQAGRFMPPQWVIFLGNDRKKGVPFDFEAFQKIIS